MTADGIAFSGTDLVVLLRVILRLRMAVTVLRLSTAAGHAIAEESLPVVGCNADFTEPSPGPSDDNFVGIPILPAMYVPGIGSRDKDVLRRTEDGCGCVDDSDVAGLFKSEPPTATLLLPLMADDSNNPEDRRSHAPA